MSAPNGEIHLLPALPSFWVDGEMRGLCARGGITVNLKWANGMLQSVGLYSRQKQKVRVRYKERCKTIHLDKGINHFDLSSTAVTYLRKKNRLMKHVINMSSI